MYRIQKRSKIEEPKDGHESHGSSTASKIAKMGNKTSSSVSFTTKETSTSISDTQPPCSVTNNASCENIYERTEQMNRNNQEDLVKIWYESKSIRFHTRFSD